MNTLNKFCPLEKGRKVGTNMYTDMMSAVEMMTKKFGTNNMAKEVESIMNLSYMAIEDRDNYIIYTEAVKEVCGDNFEKGVFANMEHERRARKFAAMAEFAAKEITRHASWVHKISGMYILPRRYDLNSTKECFKCIEDFKEYATEVAVRCYLAK